MSGYYKLARAMSLAAIMVGLLTLQDNMDSEASSTKKGDSSIFPSWMPLALFSSPEPPPAATEIMDTLYMWLARLALASAGTLVPLFISEYFDELHAGHRCSVKSRVARCVHDRTKAGKT